MASVNSLFAVISYTLACNTRLSTYIAISIRPKTKRKKIDQSLVIIMMKFPFPWIYVGSLYHASTRKWVIDGSIDVNASSQWLWFFLHALALQRHFSTMTAAKANAQSYEEKKIAYKKLCMCAQRISSGSPFLKAFTFHILYLPIHSSTYFILSIRNDVLLLLHFLHFYPDFMLFLFHFLCLPAIFHLSSHFARIFRLFHRYLLQTFYQFPSPAVLRIIFPFPYVLFQPKISANIVGASLCM